MFIFKLQCTFQLQRLLFKLNVYFSASHCHQRQITTVDARLIRRNHGDGPLDRPTLATTTTYQQQFKHTKSKGFSRHHLVMTHNPAHDLFSIGNFLCLVWVVGFCDTSNCSATTMIHWRYQGVIPAF